MKSLRNILYLSNVDKSGLKFFALGCAAIAGLVGCSDGDKTAGGGPSGTEAGNAIVATIVNEGAPVARAKVNLIESESLDFDAAGESSYTANTDENGIVEFNEIPKGKYTLEASTEGLAIQIPVSVNNQNIDLGENSLQQTATINGIVDGISNGTIKVRGLDHSAKVSTGKFSLQGMPAGTANLVFIPETESADTTFGYVNSEPGQTANATSFEAEKGFLLIEDFEDLNNQHRYAPAFTPNGGWWFVTADSAFSLETNSSTTSIPLETDSTGSYMHIKATVAEGAVNPWLSTGVQIGNKLSNYVTTYDLSSVDTIAFDTKGEGIVFLQILDESRADDSSKVLYEAQIDLPGIWVTHKFALDEIIPNEKDRTMVSMITWSTKDNIDFFLDNLKFIGGDKNLIWNRQ